MDSDDEDFAEAINALEDDDEVVPKETRQPRRAAAAKALRSFLLTALAYRLFLSTAATASGNSPRSKRSRHMETLTERPRV